MRAKSAARPRSVEIISECFPFDQNQLLHETNQKLGLLWWEVFHAMVISRHGHRHHIHSISDQDWKGTTAWGSIAHQRHHLWPLKTNLYQLNIGWTSWRRNILLTAATKIHLPTFSEVGFRSWRRTFGEVVRVKPWFDCKNRWTSQMGIEHLLLYLQNMLLFCCRIELPYEHWWATTLRESFHHTWHVILLSDSSMLANLVFLVEVGSCTPLILWAHFVFDAEVRLDGPIIGRPRALAMCNWLGPRWMRIVTGKDYSKFGDFKHWVIVH